MKFIVDAQLPRRLAVWLGENGHDAIHTLDLPDGNRSTDQAINELSVTDQRIVVTKDADFVNSFVLSGRPYKLLLISTGNIGNRELEAFVFNNISSITGALESARFIEFTRTQLIVHQ